MALLTRVLVVFLVSAVPAHAQAPGGTGSAATPPSAQIDYETIHLQRVVTAVRITDPLTIDGRLSDPAWTRASPAADFLQRTPRTGEPANERTEVRFLYDDDNLYVGVMCFDSDPTQIAIKELKRDFNVNGSDMVQVILDSLHDRRSAFAMAVNPAGGRRDSQYSQNGQSNPNWDGVWDATVSRSEEGWSVEYVIPFKTLRFSNAPEQEWGLQITRRIPRYNEESNWAPLPIRYPEMRVSLAGTLRGLEHIRPGRNLQIKPFIVGQTTQTRTGSELQTVESFGTWEDYDKGFDVKYSLTPSLTLDTTYRTDFAQVEVDQQQVNLTRFNLFFPEKRDFFLENSGIFGFGAQRRGPASRSANLVPFFSRRIGLSPTGTPVPITGGGRVTGQIKDYDIGFLAMKTEATDATPSNNYVVGRVRRNLARSSWVGVLGTHRDSTTAGDYNRVYGADAHFQFLGKLDFDAYLLRSDTPSRSGGNYARRFQTSWRDNERDASIEYNHVGANFIPDVGFIRRGNMSQYKGNFAWLPRLERNDTIRHLIFGTVVDYIESGTTGDIETRTQEATTGVQFENNGSTNFTVTRTFDRLLQPFAIRSGISIPAGDYDYLSQTADVNTGTSRKIVGTGSYTWGEFWNGRNSRVSGTLGLRLNYHFSLDLNYSRNHVTLPNGTFTTDLFGTRFLYAFTSRAFVNAFFQYNADTRQVSSNIRFNIIHHPLSDLFIVYNDTRDTRRGHIAGRTLIIKVTNLFKF